MEVLMLLVFMAAVGALFLPGLLRAKALNSPLQTVTDFRRGMIALASQTRKDEYMRREPVMYRSREDPYESAYPEDDSGDYGDYYEPDTNRTHTASDTQTRRQRIIVGLLAAALVTGIMALVPSLKWIFPLHFFILVILAVYFLLIMLIPYYSRGGRRR